MNKPSVNFDEIKSNRTKIIKTQMKASLTEEELADVLIPEIYEDDNELNRIVKQLLIDNPINIKIYQHRFNNDLEMSNMKRALSKNSTMSWERFCRWMYVLGYDAKFVITEKEDNTY